MSVAKRIWITAIIIVCTICLGINIWYLSIKIFGKQKLISDTYEIGVQTLKNVENPDDTKYFIEVNLMADMFEIKFNYMLDENQSAFYSQGLQFLADSDGKIRFGRYETTVDEDFSDNGKILGWKVGHYKRFVDGYLKSNHYNYMSGNDYEDCLISSNPIGNKSFFKIQLGTEEDSKLYGMKFKCHGIVNEENKVDNPLFIEQAGWYDYSVWGRFDKWDVTQYYSFDFIYFAEKIYNSIQSVPNGTNHALVFEFADLFDYYEYDEETRQYSTNSVASENVNSIEQEVKSYYSILVNKSDNKVQKASDSLFNCVAGDGGYNISGDIETEDYFVGRTTIDVGVNHFDFVQVSGNSYALKLSDKFISYYEEYSDVIVLDILIDLEFFKENGYEFAGLTADNNLNKFKILNCRTSQMYNGIIVYGEVDYA